MTLLEKQVYDYIKNLKPEPNSVRKRINVQKASATLGVSEKDFNDTVNNLIKNGYLQGLSNDKLTSKSLTGRNPDGSLIIKEESKNIFITVMVLI